MFEFKFEAMGTELEIKALDQISPILQEKIKSEIFNYTVFYDEKLSRFKTESIVTKIANSTGIFEVPNELVELLKIYRDFYEITGGQMNPLIGNTISDLGYDTNYTLTKKEIVRSTPNLLETLEIIDSTHIKTKDKVLIDVGAIGKGFWVDKVCEILERNNIHHYLVNGSGDIYYKNSSVENSEPLVVGLENSEGLGLIGNVKILNEAICGSGINKRNWSVRDGENLHHVINAKTNQPTENISSVWVKVKNSKLPTTFADALATAIFFVDPEILQKIFSEKYNYTFEYLIIYTNKKILFSENFNANFL